MVPNLASLIRKSLLFYNFMGFSHRPISHSTRIPANPLAGFVPVLCATLTLPRYFLAMELSLRIWVILKCDLGNWVLIIFEFLRFRMVGRVDMEVLVGEVKVVVELAAVTVVVMLSCRWKALAEVRELKMRERERGKRWERKYIILGYIILLCRYIILMSRRGK